MTELDWAVIGNFAQAVAAGVSVFALIFVGYQIYAARNSTDLVSLIEFQRSISNQEDRFLHASDNAEKNQAFVELLNILEVYAAAINGRLLHGISRSLVADKLRDAIALIELDPAWAAKFNQVRTTGTTFSSLDKFRTRERSKINEIKERSPTT